MTPARSDNAASDALTVLRAQLGDHDAFAQLHRRYQRRLLYYLRRLVAEEAEDVLQEVWLTVVRKVATLEDPAAFRAWLYRVARNRAMSRLRRRRVTLSWDELPAEDPAGAAVPLHEEPPTFTAVDAAALNRAFGRLSLPHREVLVLRYVQSLTYAEMAEIQDCSVGTVRSRLHYAKKHLERILAAPAASPQERNPR